MFHEGDLQSGITASIQQSKPLACFVRDENAESETWESSWLADEQIAPLIRNEAVILRVQARSPEAGFLGAFCPISAVPTLVVIRSGQVVENIVAGVSHVEFKSRVKKALNGDANGSEGKTDTTASQVETSQEEVQRPVASAAPPADSSAVSAAVQPVPEAKEPATSPPLSSANATPASTPARTTSPTSNSNSRLHPAPASSRSPAPAPASASNPPSSRIPQTNSPRPENLQNLFPERSARFGADYEARRESETAAAPSADKGKGRSLDGEGGDDSDSARRANEVAEIEYGRRRAAEARARKLVERAELRRVLASIENDKVERRLREQKERDERAANMSALPAASSAPHSVLPAAAASVAAAARASARDVSLQIRLFDGRVLRGKFPPDATPGREVRAFVDANPALAASASADGGGVPPTDLPPYTFKMLTPPHGARAIDEADEALGLAELEMAPSATLVLVPINGYVGAYAGAGGVVGAVVKAVGGLLGVAGSGIGWVGSLVGLGGGGGEQQRDGVADDGRRLDGQRGQREDAAAEPAAGEGGPAGKRTGRMRTMADQRAESGPDGQVFYNGNQLNFEPNKDDNDDKDDSKKD